MISLWGMGTAVNHKLIMILLLALYLTGVFNVNIGVATAVHGKLVELLW